MSRTYFLWLSFGLVGCAGGGAGDPATNTDSASGTQASTTVTDATNSIGSPTDATNTTGMPTDGANGLTFTCPQLPDGGIDIHYTVELEASGGMLPYHWSASGLPKGLAIEPGVDGRAQIVGTPTLLGTSLVTLSVADANGSEVKSDCGELTVRHPPAVDTTRFLAAYPTGCAPVGVGLNDLLAKNIFVNLNAAPITCEMRIGHGMGGGQFVDGIETMPPGISLNATSCVVSGAVEPFVPVGVYGFIVTYSQGGFDTFVPYCATQVQRPATAYKVERRDAGLLATFEPGLQVLDFVADGPVEYGTAIDPVVTVTDDVGACSGNTCFYAFVFSYNTLSSDATVSANPTSKFPAMGFEGFTHALRVGDAAPSLFTFFKGRPFVVNVRFDYCIGDNADKCGNNQPNTPAGAAKRAELIRINGGQSSYYFSLIVLPKN